MSTPSAALGNRTPEQLKVAELREELRKRGIQIKGLKKDLVDRLEEVLRQEELQEQDGEQEKEPETVPEDSAPVEAAAEPEPLTPVAKKKRKSKGDDAVAKEAPVEVAASEPENADIVAESAPEGNGEAEILPAAQPQADEEVKSKPPSEPGVDDEPVTVESEAAVETATPGADHKAAGLEEEIVVAHIAGTDEPVAQSVPPAAEEPTAQSVSAAEEDLVAHSATAAGEEPMSEVVPAAAEELVTQSAPAAEEEEPPVAQPVPAAAAEEQEPMSEPVAVLEEEEPVAQPESETHAAPVSLPSPSMADKEESITAAPLVAELGSVDLESSKGIEEELPVQPTEVQESERVVEEEASEKPTEIMLVVAAADEAMEGGSEEQQIVTTSVEEHIVTTTVEEQVVTTTTVEEQTVTTVVEEQTVTTVVEEQTAMVVEDESLQIDSAPAKEVEDKSDDVMEEAPKESSPKVVDGAAAAEGEEEAKAKDVKPMEIDADSQTGSKRKEAADEEIRTQEPTKRRRWNSGKGESNIKAPARIATTDVEKVGPPSLDLKDAAPSSNAPPVPPATTTPKSAPALERVAITRATPSRTEPAVNGETQKARVVPPSAKPATTSLKIDRFVRPFTFKAVKALLAQTGTVGDVWMDQIKTHCYVTYSSVEEAIATRDALYNLQWPPQGGRSLTAEFVDPAEVKTRCDGEKAAAAAAAATPTVTPTANAVTPRGPVPANSKAPADREVTASTSSQPPLVAAAPLPPPPPLPFPPRDRPKQVTALTEVEKTPTLDDLFKKTRVKPHIYYLPLTAQEVAEKTRNQTAVTTKPGAKA